MRKSMGAALAALWLVAGAEAALAQSERPVIRSEADLPPTRFPMPELPSAVVMSDAFLTRDLPLYRAEAERIVADYDIEDPTIAQSLRLGLVSIAWLQDRPEEALALTLAQREAETKPQLRQIGHMLKESLAVGLAAGEGARCAAAAERMSRTLSAADPLVIRDEVLGRYGVVQVISPGYHIGSAALVVDPEAKAQGSIGLRGALRLANMRFEADAVPQCRAELLAVLQAWIDDPTHRPVDIWPQREPTAADLEGARPVAVAVWESGFDPSLFSGQIAIDPAEPLDGVDNDGNGVIDDAFGPTFDRRVMPTTERMLLPSPEFAARYGLQSAIEKGLADLGYGEDTPEARFVAERSRDAGVEDQLADVRVSQEWNVWSHATWVASLIADPAPFVRLYAFNILPFGYDPDPVKFEEEDAARMAAILPAAAARLRASGVRVVNMSWGSTADEWAEHLLTTGSETDPERAVVRGAAIAETVGAAVERVIRESPDILFVAGAGNSDQSDDSQAAIPQTLDLPNVLVVGGAGTAGNATAFTTYGGRVRLFALAEGNIVRGPGGQVLRRSGTSFAGPIAARAAASMLAVNPTLTSAEVVEGLLATVRPAGDGTFPLLDAGAAVRWARAAD